MFVKKLIGVLFIIFGFNWSLFAKRSAPPVVNPLVIVDQQISVHFQQNSKRDGYRVILKSEGLPTWTTVLYERRYRPDLETDVQDVYISKLEQQERFILATDEQGTKYKITLDTGRLVTGS
jgi:hypothetical protein